MTKPKSPTEPETSPVEYTPAPVVGFKPIEYTPYQDTPVAPVAEHTEPLTGEGEN